VPFGFTSMQSQFRLLTKLPACLGKKGNHLFSFNFGLQAISELEGKLPPFQETTIFAKPPSLWFGGPTQKTNPLGLPKPVSFQEKKNFLHLFFGI